MESIFYHLLNGFATALTGDNLFAATAGAVMGMFIGALPGIGSVMGVALLLPLTFKMDPTTAIIMLAALYYSTMYAGSFTAILINIPGDPPALMTTLDGYQLTLKGKAGKALAVSNWSSFVAGFIGVIILTFMGPLLADIGLAFGPAEMTTVILLALSAIAWLLGDDPLKGLLSTCLGILLATVGLDAAVGRPRFAFGIIELLNGIDFIPLVIGLLGVNEIIEMALQKGGYKFKTTETLSFRSNYLNFAEIKQIFKPTMISSVLGTFIGCIPGAGTNTASFLCYVLESRTGNNKENMGKGALEGVAAPEAANNAAAAGAFAPLLALGIPSSGTVTVLLGGLMMWGITPGPLLFTEHPDLAWGLIASMYTGNIVCMIIAALSIPLMVQALRVPPVIMTPIIIVICMVSAYAANNSLFDVWLMIIFGIVGYFFCRYKYPVAPFLMAFILTPRLEMSARQAFDISNGDPAIFLQKPIALAFLTATLFFFIASVALKFCKMCRIKLKRPSDHC
ncbi:tricarboxylate transporter [Anaerosporomusa subterranea]|uniref:Tricarboxylate transporter n=1 Tax=Anaerosporomusa subterranea TaxID=1794912 RepID=A0A154BVJ1_ANASB|nr:tripartite tricarboxylate transporter permease [Anaerosporomusa subterranea]KYZ77949.1 tricarboxylate transporter [Anaerosporomusa subterranea]